MSSLNVDSLHITCPECKAYRRIAALPGEISSAPTTPWGPAYQRDMREAMGITDEYPYFMSGLCVNCVQRHFNPEIQDLATQLDQLQYDIRTWRADIRETCVEKLKADFLGRLNSDNPFPWLQKTFPRIRVSQYPSMRNYLKDLMEDISQHEVPQPEGMDRWLHDQFAAHPFEPRLTALRQALLALQQERPELWTTEPEEPKYSWDKPTEPTPKVTLVFGRDPDNFLIGNPFFFHKDTGFVCSTINAYHIYYLKRMDPVGWLEESAAMLKDPLQCRPDSFVRFKVECILREHLEDMVGRLPWPPAMPLKN